MKESILYTIVRPIATFLFKILYRPKYIGKENIPSNGRIILASNHTNNLDCIFLMSSTKRHIHFLAKIELFRGFKKIIFNNMGLIPVDRKYRTTNPLEAAYKYLNDDKVIGIFPEGTINRTDDTILHFKKGVIKMSYETNSYIVPTIIKGDYKIFSKNLTIKYLKPIYIKKDNIEDAIKELEGIFIKELEDKHDI